MHTLSLLKSVSACIGRVITTTMTMTRTMNRNSNRSRNLNRETGSWAREATGLVGLVAATAGLGLFTTACMGWDAEGHRLVNQIGLASLPTNFPAFVLTPEARERIGFLGGEADRWRNSPDSPLRHVNAPDHFLDVEDLEPLGLSLDKLPPHRFDYVGQIAVARHLHPDKFPPIDEAKDPDHTRHLPGFLPWAITEQFAKLKSGFSYWKAYQEGGTPEEIRNAEQNIIYVMGVMGHFVADAAQPLHTTRHYNGWVGENPKGYSTNRTFHSWIDGGYFRKLELPTEAVLARVKPARVIPKAAGQSNIPAAFPEALRFLGEQFKTMELTYQMEKDGKFSGNGEKGKEGLAFLSEQMLKSGQFLGDLWLTAWQQSPPDNFLKSQLARRQRAAGTTGKAAESE